MKIISWNTTNACNMYCAHCYRDAGCKAEEELSTEEGKKLLSEIAKAGFKIMIFSGGEPLMRPDILELVKYASDLHMIPVFGTNGTLITLDMAKKLKEAGARAMGISLDSLDPKKHDTFRSFPGGWEGAVQGMKNCAAVGLPFQIHTTVMDWNQGELEAMTDFAVEIGAKAHHFFFLVPTGRAKTIEEESLRAEQYEDVLTRIMKKQQEVMGLYSQYGVSPMGGCLPMLIQFPILMALFMFVPSAIELRQQSFLWADDLSTYDAFINFPFHIPFLGSHLSLFCLLMTVTNILNTKYMMQQQDTGANPQMAAMKWMSYLMPIMFLFILNDYPSGLNYYYFISTLVSVVTTLIMRKTTNEEALLAQLEANKKDPKKMKKTGFAARLEAMQKQQEQMMKERQNKK